MHFTALKSGTIIVIVRGMYSANHHKQFCALTAATQHRAPCPPLPADIPCLCSLATPLPAQASETPAAAKGKAAAATAGVTYELYVDGGAAGCAAPTASGELARTCLCS